MRFLGKSAREIVRFSHLDKIESLIRSQSIYLCNIFEGHAFLVSYENNVCTWDNDDIIKLRSKWNENTWNWETEVIE